MSESHRIEVGTDIHTDDNSEERAVAYATMWLLDELGEVDAFHEVQASTWKGAYTVTFLAPLTDDQVDTLNETIGMTDLGIVE